jgi:MATE family multidrug resistance protein
MSAATIIEADMTGAGSYGSHVRATVVMAAPIALALLCEIGMGLISTLFLGSLGDRALAAGAFGSNAFFTVLLILQGMLSGVGVRAANRIGAGAPDEVPGIYWSGVAVAVLLAVPMFVVVSVPASLWRALGEPAALSDDIAAYMQTMRWAVPAGVVGIGMMRQFLPAIGLQRVLMWVLPAGVVLHFALNLVLVRGVAGFGGYGLTGSAAATVITLTVTAAILLAVLHGPRFGHFVRATRPDAGQIRSLLAIGLPVGGIVTVEVGMFLGAAIMAGILGGPALAAHMIALSVASVAFMVPLAISQAANVRVAGWHGADNRPAARRAGFSAIGVSIAFMSASALVLSFAPGVVVGLYLPATTANAATAALAARLLRVAGVFQLADGTQVTAAGALRGLQDVRVPMLMAAFGYWGIGFWAGWYLAFPAGMGAVGLWWGLCAGLAVVAGCLLVRFARFSGGEPQEGSLRHSH